MGIKLRRLIIETDNTINEKIALPSWKLDQISREIVTKYFASSHNPARISKRENGVEQNKMLKDLTTSITGAIKSVLKNYPSVYSFEDANTILKK
jgi:hypothetical protein